MKKRGRRACTIPKKGGYPIAHAITDAERHSRADPRVKAKAWEMYVAGEKTIAEICVELKLSYHTVIRQWISSNGENWSDKRKKLERELMEMVNLQASNAVRRHFSKVVMRHIGLAERMDVRIEELLKAGLNPRELEAISKAFKNSADIAARAVGLDKGNSVAQVAQQMNQTINYNSTFQPIPVNQHAADFMEAEIAQPALLTGPAPAAEPLAEKKP